jgi:hypothetical protein
MVNFDRKIQCSSIHELQKGCLISNSGKNLFIKQPNNNDIDVLQRAILENIKLVNNVFNMRLNFN